MLNLCCKGATYFYKLQRNFLGSDAIFFAPVAGSITNILTTQHTASYHLKVSGAAERKAGGRARGLKSPFSPPRELPPSNTQCRMIFLIKRSKYSYRMFSLHRNRPILRFCMLKVK